jgi:hypothetical protein
MLLASCKLSEDNIGTENRLELDGVYIAANTNTRPITGPDKGKIIGDKKSILLIRFYDAVSGVIVPLHADTSNHFTDNRIINEYYDWCKEFEKKNPKDKDFVNFRYRIVNDTLSFEQKGEEVIYKWKGIVSGDSLVLNKAMYIGDKKTGAADLVYRFGFYPRADR